MQKEIIERIKATFEANPQAELFHVTSDGQCFFKRNEATVHARSLKDGSILTVSKGMMENLDANQSSDSNKPSLEQRLAKVEQASTIQELEALLEGETAKTVKSAIDLRIQEFNQKEILKAIASAKTPEEVDELIKGLEDETILQAAQARKQEFE